MIYASPQRVKKLSEPTKGPLRLHSHRGAPDAELVNQALSLRGTQAELKIGAVNDRLEREADRITDQIMRSSVCGPSPEHGCQGCTRNDLQRQPVRDDKDEGKEKNAMPPKSKTGRARPTVTAAATATAIRLQSATGQPLPPSVRSFFEPRFAADLRSVRVHNNCQAQVLASRFSARAFTVGSNVFFGVGEYAPETQHGRRLLSHELVHVMQQGMAETSLGVQRRARRGSRPAARRAKRKAVRVKKRARKQKGSTGWRTRQRVIDAAQREVTILVDQLNSLLQPGNWGNPLYGGRARGAVARVNELVNELSIWTKDFKALEANFRVHSPRRPNTRQISQEGTESLDDPYEQRLLIDLNECAEALRDSWWQMGTYFGELTRSIDRIMASEMPEDIKLQRVLTMYEHWKHNYSEVRRVATRALTRAKMSEYHFHTRRSSSIRSREQLPRPWPSGEYREAPATIWIWE